MTNDEQICLTAKAENNKPFLLFRMLRVINHQRFFVVENRFCFLKGNLVFVLVDVVFIFISLKSNRFHIYIIIII